MKAAEVTVRVADLPWLRDELVPALRRLLDAIEEEGASECGNPDCYWTNLLPEEIVVAAAALELTLGSAAL